jgi:Uma2 family endonuclease
MASSRAYVPGMMNQPSSPLPMTAEELLHLSLPDKQTELVRGVLVVREPPGLRHGVVSLEIAARLREYVRAHALGLVVAAETGFKICSHPDTVRAADAAYIQRERVPDSLPVGYAELAPDLVVEVLSPNDRPGEVLQKVGDWLSAGSRLAWVVDPTPRRARVYRADGSESLLGEGDVLEGEDVLPGFSCRLEALW